MILTIDMTAQRNRMKPRKRPVPTVYLKAWLDHLEVRQYELADRLGVNKSVISKVVSGQNDLTVAGAVAMAEALGIEDRDLFRHPSSAAQQETDVSRIVSDLPEDERSNALRALRAFIEAGRKP